MDRITIGQIAIAVSSLVGLISGIAYLKSHLKKWISGALSEQLDAINSRIDDIDINLKNVDMEACKNYLVHVLSRVERGDQLDDIELERFWEQYEHYIKNGGNSYIKRRVEQLKEDDKL